VRCWAARFGEPKDVRQWWVPGRIELLGKHVDYAGGRSLLVAIDRGFHVLARPRRDRRVTLVDARSRQPYHGTIDPETAQHPGRWMDYPATVVRRLARDFPGAATGMDAVIASSLPSAAGLSSSSALVTATFLPLAAFNRLDARSDYRAAIDGPDALAGYLGAVENGHPFGALASDRGVGTLGGSQDHTAILRCRRDIVSGFRFLPVALESETPFPDDLMLVVAASGVPAPKAGTVREHYNRLARQAATLLGAWDRGDAAMPVSLLDLLTTHSDAADRLATAVGRLPDGTTLCERLQQFREECLVIIPGVVEALRRGDTAGLGQLVDRSHQLADQVLRNQVAETNRLVRIAREQGALAASGFGAGFGGSVWALVRRDEAGGFREAWLAAYLAEFPAHVATATSFASRPAGGACEVA
jgi:galactokinase